MCLIVFAYNQHPKYKFVLAANRDEFYARPTTTANWWNDHTNILGGRDLEAKGTWMGIHKNGRFAAVTNYRDIQNIKPNARTRGDLPTNFLAGKDRTESYTTSIHEDGDQYNGFNLIVLDESMGYTSNYHPQALALDAGIYGLSNALLDTPWTKVEKAKSQFKKIIAYEFEMEDLLEMMQDDEKANDDELPQTGLDYEREKALSSMCIRTPDYGTCCTTVVTISHENEVSFIEKSYPVGDRKDEIVSYSFLIDKKA